MIEGMNTVFSPEEFILLLKHKIAVKKEELEKSEFWKIVGEQVITENL